MNIVFFAPDYIPHIGGVEKHIMKLSEILIKDGHQISIITYKSSPEFLSFESDGNLSIYRVSRTYRYLNSLRMFFFITGKLRLLLNADVLHFHDFSTYWNWGLPFYGFFKLLKKRTYITFHGWEGFVPPRKIVVLKRKICAALANGNICVGHFIEKWYGTKATIINYGGVDIPQFISNTGQAKRILFVGRLAPDTGILLYLKAWKQFIRNYPDYTLEICGDGILMEKIKSIIKDEQLPSIIIRGFVPDPSVFIKDVSVVLTSGYLGILEAFSYKKPVISVYDNRLKEDYLKMMPDSCKMMWIENDVNNISKALELALNDENKVINAFAFAQKNSWRKIANDYYSLWNVDYLGIPENRAKQAKTDKHAG